LNQNLADSGIPLRFNPSAARSSLASQFNLSWTSLLRA
jgi:hypothetical protein